MDKSIISEGKTTNEAIENGLKKLNVSKNMVDIKVLENEEVAISRPPFSYDHNRLFQLILSHYMTLL